MERQVAKELPAKQLERLLVTRQAKIAVIGLGYVGLPLAVEKAKAGFAVYGIERNSDRVNQVNAGKSYIPDVLTTDMRCVWEQGTLKASSDFEVVSQVDVITICVPTPLDAYKQPDTRYIESVVDSSVPFMRSGQLVVLESTTYPGTTEEIIQTRIEQAGFKVGTDVFLAFSPERVDPGNKHYKTANTPKVVGGVTPTCTRLAATMYEQILEGEVFTVSSPQVAEMEKLLENIFRVVNISLMNELAKLSDRMGIDIWEVVAAASTKPFGYMPFYPGPGLGGHCIPIDPFYLSWKAKEYDFTTQFIELAGAINNDMPGYVVQRIAEILNEHGLCLKGSNILLMGVAYKADVDDTRESPALKVAGHLLRKGALLRFHDPLVSQVKIKGELLTSVPTEDLKQSLSEADIVVILTGHNAIDYESIVDNAKLVYDTRNRTAGHSGEHLYRLGTGR